MSNLSCTEPNSFTPHHGFHRFEFAEPTLTAFVLQICTCVTRKLPLSFNQSELSIFLCIFIMVTELSKVQFGLKSY